MLMLKFSVDNNHTEDNRRSRQTVTVMLANVVLMKSKSSHTSGGSVAIPLDVACEAVSAA